MRIALIVVIGIVCSVFLAGQIGQTWIDLTVGNRVVPPDMAIDIANVKVPFLVGMRVLDVGLLIDNVVIAIVAWRYNREVVNGQAVSHIIIFEFDVNDIFIAGNNVSARQFMDDFYLLDPFRIDCPDIIKVSFLPVNYHKHPFVVLNADF